MIEFVLGSLYTILILAVGGYVGYIFGADKMEQTVREIRRKVAIKKVATEGGPVKIKKQSEKEREKNGDFESRVKEITG